MLQTLPARGALPKRARFVSVTFVASIALAGLGAISGCHKPSDGATAESSAKKPGGQPPIKSSFGKVEEKKVPPRLEVTGTLDPDERSEVAAQTAGVVSSVTVDIGTRVKKGDVLVELDAREAALKLSAAAATAESQRARLGLEGRDKFDPENVADVKAAREARDLASAEYDRSKALFDSGAISKAALDSSKTNKERADAGYESARNGAQQAFAGLLASQSQTGLSSKSVDDTKIRAPFDGSVVEKRVSTGEFAAMGKVVVVLVRDNPLRFRFEVPESDAASITLDSPVQISVDAYKGRIFEGSIKRISASMKVATRTLPVEAEVKNDDLTLRPGFFARASVSLAGEPKLAKFVPAAAVTPVGAGFRVFVLAGDHVEERLVTLGPSDGELREVRGDVKPGEEVAVESVDLLSDGAPVAR